MAGRMQRDPMEAILQTRQEPQQEQPQQVEQPAAAFDAEKERAALGIEPTEKRGRGKPRSGDLIRGGAQDGLTEEWTRSTFIMRVSTLQKLKAAVDTQISELSNVDNFFEKLWYQLFVN